MKKVVLPHPGTHPGVPRDPATPVRVPEAEFTAHTIDNPLGPFVLHPKPAHLTSRSVGAAIKPATI